jgi:hypothetical protein
MTTSSAKTSFWHSRSVSARFTGRGSPNIKSGDHAINGRFPRSAAEEPVGCKRDQRQAQREQLWEAAFFGEFLSEFWARSAAESPGILEFSGLARLAAQARLALDLAGVALQASQAAIAFGTPALTFATRSRLWAAAAFGRIFHPFCHFCSFSMQSISIDPNGNDEIVVYMDD